MKFKILQKNLLQGLNIVSKAVTTKSPMAILSNVLIRTENGGVRLTGSDLQFTISCWVGASVEKEGEVTVPAKVMNELISELRDEKISFELKGAKLKLETENTKTKINTTPATDFPLLEQHKESYEFDVKLEDLSNAIQKTQYSVANDESRPVLTGHYCIINNKNLKIVGLDGFRLAEYSIKIKNPSNNSKHSFIIPSKQLAEVVKSLSTYGSEDVKFKVNSENNYLNISSEDIESQIILISGEYPDYESIVPKEYKLHVLVDKDALLNGIKLVNVFAKDLGNSIKLKIANNKIILESQPSELGTNTVTVDADVDGEDLTIIFNARFLIDFLNNTSEETVNISLTESKKPATFKSEGIDNHWYLVMPMNSSW